MILCHCFFSIFSIALLSHSSSPLRASTITSKPRNWCCCRRKLSRIKRLIRLRCTAKRMFFLAIIKPKRAESEWLLRERINRCWCEARNGALANTASNSADLISRRVLGKAYRLTAGASSGHIAECKNSKGHRYKHSQDHATPANIYSGALYGTRVEIRLKLLSCCGLYCDDELQRHGRF